MSYCLKPINPQVSPYAPQVHRILKHQALKALKPSGKPIKLSWPLSPQISPSAKRALKPLTELFNLAGPAKWAGICCGHDFRDQIGKVRNKTDEMGNKTHQLGNQISEIDFKILSLAGEVIRSQESKIYEVTNQMGQGQKEDKRTCEVKLRGGG